MKKPDFLAQRARLQRRTAVALPIVVLGGWWFPFLGLFLVACMIGAVAIAFRRGRQWCDWMCPRGSFYDLILGRWSLKRPLPAFFKRRGFRVGVLALLLLALGAQVAVAWPDPRAVGLAMVRVLTITTTLGIVLGALFQPRAWCHICPMGSVGSFLGKEKMPLALAEGCRSCRLCEKACPMQLKPYLSEGGFLTDGDCLKCSSCVATCPKKLLSFPATRRAA